MEWEKKTHTLKYPVDFDLVTVEDGSEVTKTVSIKVVNIQVPKGKQMRHITRLVNKVESDPDNYSEMDMMMDAMEIMSDAPKGSFDEMHASDIVIMANLAGPFLETVMGSGPSSQNSPTGGQETKAK